MRAGEPIISTGLHRNRVTSASRKKRFLGTNNGGISSVYITKQHASARFPCPPTQAFRAGALILINQVYTRVPGIGHSERCPQTNSVRSQETNPQFLNSTT